MIATILALVVAIAPQEQETSTPLVLQVGHVIEVRGVLEGGRFVAERAELKAANSDELLIGEVPAGDRDPSRFSLLGQLIETSDETAWQGMERGSLAGQRVKVEGSWKGPRKFRADTISPRGAGRDRLAGRIDDIRKVEGGWEATVMIFRVFLQEDTPVEHKKPVAEFELAAARKVGTGTKELERDEDDVFGKGIAITDTLRLMGQIEGKTTVEQNFNLDRAQDRDRRDVDLPVRLRMTWTPGEKLRGQVEVRYTHQFRHDETSTGNLDEVNHSGAFGETWLQFLDLWGNEGFDVTVGRQDFDDPREWIYDQNLDALRLTWIRPTWRLDVASATLLTDGSDRDQESNNFIAYLSNNNSDEHLALWTVYRDIGSFDASNGPIPDETSLHLGARILGEWLPDTAVWADFAYEMGDRPLFDSLGNSTGVDADVSAWAYDVGATWSPSFADPLYFTAGYALGRGDGDDGTFRQTGFQDNTDRWGGVTSFQYYGELINPELSNLGILTLGVGAIVAERTSLDLVFHTYTQDEAKAEYSPLPQRDADLKARPNGIDADLGWEADLILGYRRFRSWDLEIVGATFDPSAGFDASDPAYLLKVQLRYRF